MGLKTVRWENRECIAGLVFYSPEREIKIKSQTIEFWWYNYDWEVSPQAVLPLSTYALVSIVWLMSSTPNGICGVNIPYAILVELWLGRALVLGTLRSHLERCAFWMCELLKLDSCCDFCWSFFSAKVPGKVKLVVVGGCRGTFSSCHTGSCTQKDTFGGILYRQRWKGEWKRAIIEILCHQDVPSFLRSFSFYRALGPSYHTCGNIKGKEKNSQKGKGKRGGKGDLLVLWYFQW